MSKTEWVDPAKRNFRTVPDRKYLAKNTPGVSLVDYAPQIDMAGVRAYRLKRVQDELKRAGLPAILLFDAVNMRYASGIALEQVQQQRHPYRGLIVSAEKGCIAFSRDHWRPMLPALETITEIRPSDANMSKSGPAAVQSASLWAKDIAQILREHGEHDLRLPVDRLPAIAISALLKEGIKIMDADSIMYAARAIKSPDEITLFSIAISVGEAGAFKMREALRPGVTENEVFSHLHQTNIAMGGEWCDLRLAKSGGGTNPGLQEHSDRRVRAGDLFHFDTDMIGPFGTFVDFSRTFFCGPGRPSDKQRDMYKLAVEHIEHNLSIIKAGVTIGEIVDKCFRLPSNCIKGRYMSMMHGFGLTYDYPSIRYPYDYDGTGKDEPLHEYMTLCVEALIAPDDDAEAVKLEQQILVTEGGYQLLSTFPYEEKLLL
ncbi:M24 family metallopeptidase [Trinickia symbiotica]|nr:M24 family metallopeptidase [Trinickia symbiotica]